MFTLCFEPNRQPTSEDVCLAFAENGELKVASHDEANGTVSLLRWKDIDQQSDPLFLGLWRENSPETAPELAVWYVRDALKSPTADQILNAIVRHIHRSFTVDQRSMVYRAYHVHGWLNKFHFCPTCGEKLKLAPNELALRCEACDVNHYPTISPAMIVAITRNHGSEILLGRAKAHGHLFYSLIAGYCEAGESIEDTVHREAFEEVGLKIKNLQNEGSQAWPFSSSMMIGYTAEWDSGVIDVDTNELDAAEWFHVENLPAIPPPPSIANRLIELVRQRWLEKKPLGVNERLEA